MAKKVTLKSLKKELNKLQEDYNSLRLLLQPKYSFLTVVTSDDSSEVMIQKIKDVIYVTTDEHKLKIVTVSSNKYYNFDSLANMENRFEGHPYFVRTHKSYYANLQNVHKIKMSQYGRTLIYKVGRKNVEVPVSYTYLKKVKEFFDF
jgi:DNA-binding LytR/AlgR family response regulator